MADKILSCFIDESGDFGTFSHHAPYYIISMVLHNQKMDITPNIIGLNTHLRNLCYDNMVIHTGPLIRRETIYENDDMPTRKKLFNALYNAARKMPIHYICVKVKKSENTDSESLSAILTKMLSDKLRTYNTYLSDFNKIIVYYDNGQNELKRILNNIFNDIFPNVEFRKVETH